MMQVGLSNRNAVSDLIQRKGTANMLKFILFEKKRVTRVSSVFLK